MDSSRMNQTDSSVTNVECSVVVPLYNEAQVVGELYKRLTDVMSATKRSFELVLVDDGSKDDTLKLLKDFAESDGRLVIVELRRNFGQTAALAAGFDVAKGLIVVSMDGDLQHQPEEIPGFLEKLDQGFDVVSGWREKRVDNFLVRRLPSRIANWMASKLSGVPIHDFGTTFKAYRRELLEELNLYGEMHRFIPALLSRHGAKIAELPIKNIVRPHGSSSYGLSRTFRVVFDLITLRFLLAYLTRPLHFFGKAAGYCILASVAICAYVLYDKAVYNVPILVAHGPLAALGAILLLIGLGFIATGLIGEMVSRVYFEATGRKIYSVRKVYRKQ
jgi:glycosyltransferase involved in cell wall biosynthesis